MNNSNIFKTILAITVKENILRLLVIIIYSLFSGYIHTHLLIKNTNQSFFTAILIAEELTFSSIQAILIFPIFNTLIRELKKISITQIQISTNSGEINTNFAKINNIRIMINNFFELFKNASALIFLLYGIYHVKSFTQVILSIFIITIYCTYTYKSYIYSMKKRKKAWEQTKNAYQETQNSIRQAENIKQNLFNLDQNNESLNKEAEHWQEFYYTLNIRKIISNLILIPLILFMPFKPIICILYLKNIIKTEHNFRIFIQYLSDFTFLFDPTSTKNPISQYKHITIKNVKIHKIGPLSHTFKEQYILITGENGIGKTLLAKAIAQLNEYTGKIESPNSIYIGLDSLLMSNKSKGETILSQIELALSKNYELFILDEVLDLLSQENFNQILEKLKNKKILLISHKHIKTNLKFTHYIIKNNEIIKNQQNTHN